MNIAEIKNKFKSYLTEGTTFNINYNECFEDDYFNDVDSSYNKDIEIQIGNRYINHYLRSYFELSCGQRMFTGLQGDFFIKNNILPYVKEEYKKTFLSDFYKELFEYIKQEQKCCFILASNNNESKIINKVLDKLSIKKTKWTINPNSKNKIRMWVI